MKNFFAALTVGRLSGAFCWLKRKALASKYIEVVMSLYRESLISIPLQLLFYTEQKRAKRIGWVSLVVDVAIIYYVVAISRTSIASASMRWKSRLSKNSLTHLLGTGTVDILTLGLHGDYPIFVKEELEGRVLHFTLNDSRPDQQILVNSFLDTTIVSSFRNWDCRVLSCRCATTR